MPMLQANYPSNFDRYSSLDNKKPQINTKVLEEIL
jgi:hypothetical protein